MKHIASRQSSHKSKFNLYNSTRRDISKKSVIITSKKQAIDPESTKFVSADNISKDISNFKSSELLISKEKEGENEKENIQEVNTEENRIQEDKQRGKNSDT